MLTRCVCGAGAAAENKALETFSPAEQCPSGYRLPCGAAVGDTPLPPPPPLLPGANTH